MFRQQEEKEVKDHSDRSSGIRTTLLVAAISLIGRVALGAQDPADPGVAPAPALLTEEMRARFEAVLAVLPGAEADPVLAAELRARFDALEAETLRGTSAADETVLPEELRARIEAARGDLVEALSRAVGTSPEGTLDAGQLELLRSLLGEGDKLKAQVEDKTRKITSQKEEFLQKGKEIKSTLKKLGSRLKGVFSRR